MMLGPDPAELLEAIAAFLGRELRGAVADPALAFRTLIASNVTATLAAELRTEQGRELAQRERLKGLGVEDDTATVRDLEARLRDAVRAGPGPEPELVWAHAKRSLAEMLAVTNPRFDLRDDHP